MNQRVAHVKHIEPSFVFSVWRSEAPSNRFLAYDPGEVAARFLLPLCVTAWGYELEQFYDADAVAKARIETGGSGFENDTLREELWKSLNRGEPLTLRDNLIVLFQRGSLYPDDFARDTQRAIQLSRQHPRAAVVATTFERTDVLVKGNVVREYGLRDWETHFDELTRILHAEKGHVPKLLPELEEESRLEQTIRDMFQPLAEAFRSSEVVRVLTKKPVKSDIHACSVQTLGYLLLLRACEETYPFQRNFLRRIHWAYSGNGREAYGDVALAGAIWADINRLIRGMGEAEILHPYLGYKFPDAKLRHKLWSIGDKIKNETIQPALEVLVTERFGLLRAVHFGTVLGRLLKRVRESQLDGSDSSEAATLWLHDDGNERRMTVADLRDFLSETFSARIHPAFEARDAEAVCKAAEWASRLRVEERHSRGPIHIAEAAEALVEFHGRLHSAQTQLRTELQQRAGHLFAEEELGSLGPSLNPDGSDGDGGPYWRLCEAGLLRGEYSTYEDAELAELAINILNVLHADRSARHPKAVKASNLRHYLGRYLTAPGVSAATLPRDDRVEVDLDEPDEGSTEEGEHAVSAAGAVGEDIVIFHSE